MKTFSYDELDRLTGEILPERAVLSTVAFPLGGGDDQGTTTVLSACNTQNNQATGGLLGALGIPANGGSSSVSCTPAAAVSGH